MRLARPVVALALLAATLSARDAAAQERAAPIARDTIPLAPPDTSRGPWIAPDGRPIPVVLSASGGISLGSYQAGVTYALVRAMRAANADTAFRARFGLPRFELSAVTGASAGNINALLSVLEWCSAETTMPEESAFWRAWVNVGWPQLYPRQARETDDFGVFDRRYFRETLLPDIARRLATARSRPECDGIPLAVTLTRMTPAPFALTDELNAQTQRHATVVQVERLPDGAITFRQPELVLRRRSMGALVSPAVGDRGSVGIDTLFRLVLASSAFPVAFAPLELGYYRSETLRPDGRCPLDASGTACAPPGRAFFLDGGVFDNNPLSLALELHRERSAQRAVYFNDGRTEFARIPERPARAVFVGMETRRGSWPGTTKPAEADVSGFGLAGLTTFGINLVPSTREYEMQTLARSLDREPTQPASFIRATSRLMPVYGEHLGWFGAFLGRPLREHDFMAGVYDGMAFVTAEMVCGARGGRRRLYAADTTGSRHCRASELGTLLDGAWLPLGAVAREAVCDVYRFEHAAAIRDGGLAQCTAATTMTADERERVAVLAALHRTGERKLLDPVPTCSQRQPVAKVLCLTALRLQLQRAWADPAFRGAVTRWAADSTCVQGALDERLTCRADPSFIALLRDPELTLQSRAADFSFRLWEVEERIHALQPRRSDGTERFQWAPLIELGEFAARSTGQETRRGLRGSPGSIPPLAFPDAFVHLYPYSIAPVIGTAGVQAGWLPLYHVNRLVALSLPVTYDYYDIRATPASSAGEHYVRVGPGLMFKTGDNWLTDVSVNWPVPLQVAAGGHTTFTLHRGEPELAAGLLFGKFRATLGRLPAQSSAERHRKWVGTLGLSDVSGMLYWLNR